MAKHLKALFLAGMIAATFIGCSLESEPDESTLDQELNDAPATVNAQATSPTRILVSWSAVSGAIKYYIYERIGVGGAEGYVTTAAGTSVIRANLQPNTEYCYRIRTVDSTGPGPFSALACATTPAVGAAPAVPTNVTATPTSSTRITVAWSMVSNADRYYVYQSDTGANGTYAFINTVLQPGTSLNVANLQPNTVYCFKVASSNGNGTSALSAAACARTFVAGLEGYWKMNEGSGTTVTDVSGHARNGTLANGTWTTTDRAPLDNNPWAVSLSGATNSAINVADQPVWWFTGPFTLSMWTKLSSATGVIAGKRIGGCGAVDWELGQDGTGLYFRGAGTLSFGQSLTVDRWTHIGVTWDGATATLYVDGVQTASGAWTSGPRSTDPMQLGNSGGCGGGPVLVDWTQIYSRPLTPAEIQVLGMRPNPPANFTATPVGCQSVSLTWDAVPGASKYFVYKGTTSGDETFLNTVLASNTSYTDGGNACSSQHSYFVRAAQNGLISDPSAEQVVTTLPAIAAPATVTATAVSSSRINVSFSAVAGATKYYIYRSSPGGSSPYTFDGTVLAANPLTFPSSNLMSATTYSYYVVTQGPDSVSDPSTIASATTL